MTREIKFRVWCISLNKMLYPMGNITPIWSKQNGTDLVQELEDENGDYLTVDEPDDLIIEQFTGLKDRHGVEIFESDAIQSPNTTIWIVRWNNDHACFEAYSGSVVMSPIDDINCIVIGNIHANPELL